MAMSKARTQGGSANNTTFLGPQMMCNNISWKNMHNFYTVGPGQCSQYSDQDTGCWMDQSSNASQKRFSHQKNVQPGSADHPASTSMGARSFLGVKQQKCDNDHSPPSHTEVEIERSYTHLLLLCAFIAHTRRLRVLTLL